MQIKYFVGAASVLFALVLAKKYFNGGRCRVWRDLHGQIAVITGGNTGIGKETAVELARMGCTVIIGSRDVGKSKLAVTYIKHASGNDNVDYM
jgi:retinol dehydrogenase-12